MCVCVCVCVCVYVCVGEGYWAGLKSLFRGWEDEKGRLCLGERRGGLYVSYVDYWLERRMTGKCLKLSAPDHLG